MKNNILIAISLIFVLLNFKTFPTKSELFNKRINELLINDNMKRFDTIYDNKYFVFGNKVEKRENRTYNIVLLSVEVIDSLPSDIKTKELASRYKSQLDKIHNDLWYNEFEISFNKKESYPKGYSIYESKTYVIKD